MSLDIQAHLSANKEDNRGSNKTGDNKEAIINKVVGVSREDKVIKVDGANNKGSKDNKVVNNRAASKDGASKAGNKVGVANNKVVSKVGVGKGSRVDNKDGVSKDNQAIKEIKVHGVNKEPKVNKHGANREDKVNREHGDSKEILIRKVSKAIGVRVAKVIKVAREVVLYYDQ